MVLSRRQALWSLAGLSAAALTSAGLSGCNASAQPQAAAPSAAVDAVEEGAFPVTIAHKHGETVITAVPTRVATVGLKEQDDVLALGTVPVGATKWLDFGGGVYGPWATSLLAGRPAPEVLPDTGIAFEKIAALQPDLIIATYSALTAADYKKLAAIAPTVAQPKEYDDWGIPWDVQALTVGKALGQPQRMQQLVDEAKASVAAAKAAHPEFAGKVGLVGSPYEGIFVYGAQDPRPRLLTDLGFTLPADLDTVTKGAWGGQLSTEKVEFLDVDAVVWFVTKDPKEVTDAVPPYKNLEVATQGRDVYLKPGDPANEAFSLMTVLSLPALVANLVPRLAAAVDGDPATSTSTA